MGIPITIKRMSQPALFAAVALAIAAVSPPATAESIHGERSHSAYDGFYRDGYGHGGIVRDHYDRRAYGPVDRFYGGRSYRHVAPRRNYGHGFGPTWGFKFRHGHFRGYRPHGHGRGIARRVFRHHGVGPRRFRDRGFRLRYHRY